MADDIVPLEQQLESVVKRYGSVEAYKEGFCKLSAPQRENELYIFNRAFDDVIARPTKDYAAHVQLRRELVGLDEILRSAGR